MQIISYYANKYNIYNIMSAAKSKRRTAKNSILNHIYAMKLNVLI